MQTQHDSSSEDSSAPQPDASAGGQVVGRVRFVCIVFHLYHALHWLNITVNVLHVMLCMVGIELCCVGCIFG